MKHNHYPSVDIVVCAYKEKELACQCIDSLLDLSYPNYKIILVDDYSNDGTVELLKKRYPSITIIENKSNIRLSRARNVGFFAGQSKYIVTIDSDAVLAEDWLDKVVELMELDEKIGQATGKILMFDNHQEIAAAGGSMYFRGKAYDIGYEKSANDEKYNKIRQVLYACPASSIIRRSALSVIGGLAPIFLHGYEDVDFSLRLNIAGYKIFYCPEAISYHIMRKNINPNIVKIRTYYAIRNRLLIMFRNYEFKGLLRHLPKNLFFTIKDCKRYPERIWPVIKSWLWIVFHLLNIILQRKKINHFRKIKDRQLERLFNLE